MAAFDQAGLGHDALGNLWAVNQGTREVWLIDSGEKWGIFEVDWLSEDPVAGSVPSLGSEIVDVTCHPDGSEPLLEATLVVLNETPYGPSVVPVVCTVQPALIFADGFESADTSAWSSAVP